MNVCYRRNFEDYRCLIPLQAGYPSCHPTNSIQAVKKATVSQIITGCTLMQSSTAAVCSDVYVAVFKRQHCRKLDGILCKHMKTTAFDV